MIDLLKIVVTIHGSVIPVETIYDRSSAKYTGNYLVITSYPGDAAYPNRIDTPIKLDAIVSVKFFTHER